MVQLMGIVNLTPDSFYSPSRAEGAEQAAERISRLVAAGASIIDLGAVSTRPGADPVDVEEEWRRLEPVLRALPEGPYRVSVDTVSAEIVRRTYSLVGDFIVNDISAGEDDPEMLPEVARLGLTYIAMHKRGGPSTMDSMCDYPDGVTAELLRYFKSFAARAESLGIGSWILDPGLGFAKTAEQNWDILQNLEDLLALGRPVLIGAADKRFTRCAPARIKALYPGLDGTALANALAVDHGASILRVHDIE